MTQELIDERTGVFEAPQGLLSPQERAAAANSYVDPAQTLQGYQQQREQEQNWVSQVELDQIKQQNAQMAQKLQQTSQDAATQVANLQGQVQQLTQSQQLQLQQQQQQEAARQFEWSADELENHGDLRPLMERTAAAVATKTAAQVEAEIERRVQEQLQAATAPIQQQLQQATQQIQHNAQMSEQQFNNQFAGELRSLGLPNMNDLVQLPEFTSRFNQSFAPGSTETWGSVLQDHVRNFRLHQAVEMLAHFRDNTESLRPQEDTATTPARTAPRAPQTPQQMQNLSQRQQLTDLYERNQDYFLTQGKPPNGWSKPKYRDEQMELMRKINEIPTT